MSSHFPIPKPSPSTPPDPAPLEAARELHAANVDITAKVFDGAHGRMRIHGWVSGTLEEAHEVALGRLEHQDSVGEFLTFAGAPAYYKAGFLRGKASLRHGLRRWFLRARAPRVQEYFNLCWLHNRHFQVPLPLVAGVVYRRGLPTYQFLITREVPGSCTLDVALERELPAARRALLQELAREVGRMHALSFVHRDLFPRNILVSPPDWPRRIVFLDAWAGGDCFHLRTPAYDLGGFLLESRDVLTAEDRALFLHTYLEARVDQGRPASKGFLDKVRAEYASLRGKLVRDPSRLRGRPLPAPWQDPGIEVPAPGP